MIGLDEIIDLLRAAWGDDPTTHEGRFYPSFTGIRVLPKPVGSMPIWVGGGSDAAVARAAARGDGYAGTAVEPQDAKALVERLRALRSEEDFTISLRVGWDARNHSVEEIREQRAIYEDAGIQHVIVAPVRGSIDWWLEGMEIIAGALGVAA